VSEMDSKTKVIEFLDDIEKLCKQRRLVLTDEEKVKLAIEMVKADALQQISKKLDFDNRMEDV
jgi:hypothetical protein